MILFEQALRVIETSVSPLSTEEVPLEKALNRILAKEVISDVDMPPFNKAAMDGFACRKSDLGNELTIIEEIPAGKVPVNLIAPNQCARIMTGAMVPEGADFVLMKEHAEFTASKCVRCIRHAESGNICYQGEDVKTGDTVLSPGIKLLPAHLAIMAALGCVRPLVTKMPEVAVISTGDELVEPGDKLGAGKIRNSNGLQLTAQAWQLGLQTDYLGIVPDNRQKLLEAVSDALSRYHVILITGGVSVGDYDFIPDILRELQVDILFHGMKVKPGRHVLFGKKGNHFVIGLPGNPVSAFVLFELLVKTLLGRLMGSKVQPAVLHVPLAESYSRRNQDMLFFIPVSLTGEGTALPLEYHGSAHIHAYAAANGMMEVPVGVKEIKKGELVHVRLI
jgi:molybdopterin molybdotransferase